MLHLSVKKKREKFRMSLRLQMFQTMYIRKINTNDPRSKSTWGAQMYILLNIISLYKWLGTAAVSNIDNVALTMLFPPYGWFQGIFWNASHASCMINAIHMTSLSSVIGLGLSKVWIKAPLGLWHHISL